MYQRWEHPPPEFSVILSHNRQDSSRGGPGQRRIREDRMSNSVDDGPFLCLLTLFFLLQKHLKVVLCASSEVSSPQVEKLVGFVGYQCKFMSDSQRCHGVRKPLQFKTTPFHYTINLFLVPPSLLLGNIEL